MFFQEHGMGIGQERGLESVGQCEALELYIYTQFLLINKKKQNTAAPSPWYQTLFPAKLQTNCLKQIKQKKCKKIEKHNWNAIKPVQL